MNTTKQKQAGAHQQDLQIALSLARGNSPAITSQSRRLDLIAYHIERALRVKSTAPLLLEAAKKTLAFIDDLSASNPGFMGKLCLQNYAQWNEAMIELPHSPAAATATEGEGK